jgi:hypothetical protein
MSLPPNAEDYILSHHQNYVVHYSKFTRAMAGMGHSRPG